MKTIISKSILILAAGLLFNKTINASNLENPKTIEIANMSSVIITDVYASYSVGTCNLNTLKSHYEVSFL